jgi:hypothetical protein
MGGAGEGRARLLERDPQHCAIRPFGHERDGSDACAAHGTILAIGERPGRDTAPDRGGPEVVS